jgi:putative tricarboxylic transport membrane protein
MAEGLLLFFAGIVKLCTPLTIFNVLWATQLGIIVGMLPGLTATMGVALLTTLTYKMDPGNAIVILICMYIGAIYGGSRSAILLNIPGTPANAATTVDGHPLALKGQAGRAIGIATTGSFIGSVIGMVLLAFFTPLIGNFALEFQSYEFFWFSIFGIVISGNLTAPKDPLKGWVVGFFGLFVAMIGMEGIHAYVRFSFGWPDLGGGIGLIPAMVGAFGFAEILMVMKNERPRLTSVVTDRVIPRLQDITRYWKTILRSGIVGTFIGAVPGVGEDMAAWISYDLAKRTSKEGHTFGTGNIEGLLAAETGNNACVPGAIIPVLALAIPGSAPAAVLLAAMFIHGVRPGPLIMIEFPTFVYDVVAMVLFANFAMLILGLSMVRTLVKVLLIPRERLMPIIFVLCLIGSFAITTRLFDVWVMLAFGVIGYYMREMDYPMAPLILGIVLGDIVDKNLRRGLVLSDGSLGPFLTRPISGVLVAIIVFTILVKFAWFRAVLRIVQGTVKAVALAPFAAFRR